MPYEFNKKYTCMSIFISRMVIFPLLLTVLLTLPCAVRSENGVISVVIIGGTGDLAQKYLWQGFFNLYQERLGQTVDYRFYGSTRGSPEEETPRLFTILNSRLKCGVTASSLCQEMKATFINRTQYFQLKTNQDYLKLGKHLQESAKIKFDGEVGRIFYLSLPPRAYLPVSNLIHQHCRPVNTSTWLRLVLEKPFGHNKETAVNMTGELTARFDEDEIYRVDHYLGKGVVKHILPLREMNRENLDVLLNRDHVDRVEISMLETVGLKGRVDFYDQYGVICDVMQNHMLEMMTLVAMDLPVNISDSSQTKANKLRLLKQIGPVQGRSLLTAQYEDYEEDGAQETGNSNFTSDTPTFAAAVLHINSPRWNGVPFILMSGKKLQDRVSYVRIVFKNNLFNLFDSKPYGSGHASVRQLVFHVEHGAESEPAVFVSNSLGNLSLPHTLQFRKTDTPTTVYQQLPDDIMSYYLINNVDAYTSVIANIIDGLHEHFVGSDHLLSLWDIWSEALSPRRTNVSRLYSSSSTDSQLAFTVTGSAISFNYKPIVNVVNQIDIGKNDYKMSIKPSVFLGSKLVVSDINDVIRKLADDLQSLAVRAVQDNGVVHFAFSGGHTSRALFRQLAQLGPDLPWSNIHVWLVDERCTSLTDHRSNFNSIQQNLLSFVSIPYINVHPIGVEVAGRVCGEGDRGAQLYEEALWYWVPDLQFDVIVLGLGIDGHTASLFPHQPSLQETDRLAVLSTAPGTELTQRITMTYVTINAAKNVFVLVTGAEKHSTVDQIQNPDADKNMFPILGVNTTNGNMTWYIDDASFYG